MRLDSTVCAEAGPGGGLSCLTTYIALLRAVNVGGSNKLSMADLRRLCEGSGLKGAQTYIQSGNLVVKSALSESELRQTLETSLKAHMGKPIQVMVRSLVQLQAVLRHNPFPQAEAKQLIVVFLNDRQPVDALQDLLTPDGEEVSLVGREVFVHFPHGQGRSKLKLPFAKTGTGRNLNTLQKLVEMAEQL